MFALATLASLGCLQFGGPGGDGYLSAVHPPSPRSHQPATRTVPHVSKAQHIDCTTTQLRATASYSRERERVTVYIIGRAKRDPRSSTTSCPPPSHDNARKGLLDQKEATTSSQASQYDVIPPPPESPKARGRCSSARRNGKEIETRATDCFSYYFPTCRVSHTTTLLYFALTSVSADLTK